LHHENALQNRQSILLSEIGSFPAKRALHPGAIFASITSPDDLPGITSSRQRASLPAGGSITSALTRPYTPQPQTRLFLALDLESPLERGGPLAVGCVLFEQLLE